MRHLDKMTAVCDWRYSPRKRFLKCDWYHSLVDAEILLHFCSLVFFAAGRLIFEDEVTAIQREVDRLRQHGIHTIIALGHAGFNVDKKIAAEVDGLDLVVGGHTNTFLYNG